MSTPVLKQNCFSVHLDAMRGLAAVAVLVGHLRALFFVEFPEVFHPAMPIKMLYFFAGFGHQAVIVFFVLSGFLIASSVQRAHQQERWSWKWYAQNRLTRLYIVLLPALLLTGLWDRLGMHLFGQNNVYGALPAYQHIVLVPIRDGSGPGTLLGNAMFVQSILVRPFGSDSPLWSLTNEFWYYALFPLCLYVFSSASTGRKRIGAGLSALVILLLVGKDIALLFLVWLMGAGLILIPEAAMRGKSIWVWFSLGLLLAVLAAARLQKMGPPEIGDFIVGAFLAAFLSVLRAHPGKSLPHLYTWLAQFLSHVSYTLYLVHVPFLCFITAALIGSNRLWQPNGGHLVLGSGVAVVTFVYMLIIWRLTEANTDRVRRFVQGHSR